MRAIIPVNSRLSAKRRLDSLLRPEQRAELVELMLLDVVDACAAADAVDDIVVVTPDRSLAPAGVDVLRDPGVGHATAIQQALARCPAEGALVVMADCPLARPAVLDLLCEAARPVALCPAQDGGTNVLALRPADAVEPAFGVPDGARVVVARAGRLGLQAAVIEDELVALDVDRPEDAERLLELGSATRTGRFLARVLPVSAEWQASAR